MDQYGPFQHWQDHLNTNVHDVIDLWITKQCILISTGSGVQYDAAREDKTAWESKQKEIQRIEDAKKAEAEKSQFCYFFVVFYIYLFCLCLTFLYSQKQGFIVFNDHPEIKKKINNYLFFYIYLF